MILAGFFLPAVIETVACAVSSGWQAKDGKDSEEKASGEKEAADFTTRARIIAGILVGDFFHNLCDGFFLGAAFSGCGSDFGWKVAIGTIAHEFAQELADYTVLTGPEAGLQPFMALVLNFLSGISVLLGTVIVLSVKVSDGG